MGATDWVDWSFNYKLSFFNPTFKILAIALTLVALIFFIISRLKFLKFRELKGVITLFILGAFFAFLGFLFRLVGDLIQIWKYTESLFGFLSALIFLAAGIVFIKGITQKEKFSISFNLPLVIGIICATWAIIFYAFLSSPNLVSSELTLEYDTSFLNPLLKMISSISFSLCVVFYMNGYKKYSGELAEMLQLLIIGMFFFYLGSICRDHGLALGLTKEISLKWFQSTFFIIAGGFLIYCGYLFYKAGIEFEKKL